MSRNPDIIFITEYIKKVLYFAVFKSGRVPVSCCNTHYFCIDNHLVYENYYLDFGPLNISCVYKYCKLLNDKLNLHSYKQVLIHYTNTDPRKTANAAFLMGCFGVLYLSMSAEQAFKPFIHGQFMSFQDACPHKSPYTITISDCLAALAKAHNYNFFNFKDFNVAEYMQLDKLQGGDLNWIVPGKFLAFIGPVDNIYSVYHPPEMYVGYFTENHVKVVIRLNKKLYDSNAFTKNGISHYDLFFPDGSCPPKNIVMKFLEISEDTNGAIAVHCKAGLGRTGTLIGCYLIKHYRMTAHEAIAWMRICRSGSVIGHQQEWLEKIEAWLIKQGNVYRRRMYQDVNRFPKHEFGIYSFFKTAYFTRPSITKLRREPSPSGLSTSPPSLKRRDVADAKKKIENEKFHLYQRSFSQNQNIVINKEKSYYIDAGSKLPSKMKRNDDAETPISRLSKHSKTDFTRDDDKTNKIVNKSCVNRSKQSQLQSLIKISMPQYYRRSQSENEPSITSNIFTKETKELIQPQFRRRLGRSPSPSVTDKIIEEKCSTKRKPTSRLFNDEKKVSKTKVSSHQRGSSGAMSLDAQRNAPVEHRASSVRSDERPIATQGDLLNSIKFSRGLKESLKADHYMKTTDKSSMTPAKPYGPTSDFRNLDTPTDRKIKLNKGVSDQPAATMQAGFSKSHSRSNSPKIRRPLTNYYYY